jgi:hypothetical protein
MGWQEMLQRGDESIVAPWIGEQRLRVGPRAWDVEQPPRYVGWFEFKLEGRTARSVGSHDPEPDRLGHRVRGYLVGDRIVVDGVRVDPDPATIVQFSECVHLIERGLDRFARVVAGRVSEDGPLVYVGPDMPLGPEDAVMRAYLRGLPSVATIKDVTPALDAAFRMESWQRAESIRLRAELEKRLREEAERRRLEEQRAAIAKKLGDGAGRREMARVDFATAAKAALAIGGAEYLDHVPCARRGEMVVRFRLDRRSFECVCHAETLSITEAGICLNDYRTGTRGDELFTLESLPGVIRQAIRQGVLHVFRHVGDDLDDYGDDD